MKGPSRFRYRRSLASRVILLTTFAVGLSVAIVALAAYLTVRHQLQSSMDASLHRRAYVAAQYDLSDYRVRDIPAFMLGATDTKVGYVTADGQTVTTKGPNQDAIPLGAPELAVARGSSDYSCRTISSQGTNYRVATIPTNTEGIALVVAQSLGGQRVHARPARRGDGDLRHRRGDRRGAGRLGRRPQRPAARCAG